MCERFAPYAVDVDWVFPPSLRDLLPEDDLVFFIHKVVEGLDMTAFMNTFSSEGGTAYPPGMYLKLMFYGYSIGVHSSRKMARLARRDVGAMYLCGGLHPEHNAINRFRLKCLVQVKDVFRQILTDCVRKGMVTFGQISLDGSKIEANASKHSAMSADHLEKRLKATNAIVDDIMAKSDTVDAVDDEVERLAELRAKAAVYEGYLAELEKRAAAQAKELEPSDQINFTDPESRMMETRHDGSQQCYNAQAAVDRGHLVIVAANLTQDCTDFKMLEPMVDQIAQNITELKDFRPDAVEGAVPDDTTPVICADAGYSSRANLTYLANKEGITALIADKREGTERNKFDKANFRYDAESNTYTCPEGKVLYPPKHRKTTDSERVPYTCCDCGPCPNRSKCVQAKSTKQRRTVLRHRDDHLVDQMREAVAANRDIYKHRMSTVEPVWGIIKLIMAFGFFSLRGLEKTSAEFLFVCSTHNLKRMWHWKLRQTGESSAQ